MKAILRRVVVATLLAVWCFPALSSANPAAKGPSPLVAQATSAGRGAPDDNIGTETDNLAAREQKAGELQNFKGGGVYIYMGSGAVLVLVIVLLILLV